MKKKTAALLCALLLALAACGSPGSNPANSNTDSPGENVSDAAGPEEARPLTVSLCAAQDTLDPAQATAQGSETILYHLFENLMRWTDGGDGWAALAPGQAESYEAETDYAGNATYTFTLREGLLWSDGEPVTANDFAAAWRRLANPANNLPHRELLRDVSGYDAVQESMDASLLAVSAPDERTFVVSLTGSPAYFLEEVCAGAYTMPVREDLIQDGSWGKTAATVTNGPYTAVQFDRGLVALEASGTYYGGHAGTAPAQIHFVTSGNGDYGRFLSGELDLVTNLPDEALQELAEGGLWTPEPVTAAWGVLLNTQQPPFDDPDVRLAFRLAIDNQAVVEALGDLTARPAVGLVPYGVSDYGERTVREEDGEEPALPAPNAAPSPAEPEPTCWDFRAHSLEKVTVPAERDYEADCQRAKALLAQAGYAGGSGFPAVEYLYVDAGRAGELAGILRSMWREQLGVTVAVRSVSQEEYDASVSLTPLPEEALDGEEPIPRQVGELPQATGEFAMAAQELVPACSDAGALLRRWYSQSGENITGYVSDAFDILIDAARAAAAPEVRDAYLHDAEAILLEDAPVIPVYFLGGSYALAEGLTGLYRAPDGVFFLYNLER